MSRSNEELLGFIGAWAKLTHREKYDATLAQVAKPRVFRNYLLRLIEIRCAEEPTFYLELPVSVLDETSLHRRIRIRSTGQELTIAGTKYAGPSNLTWTMLDSLPDDFAALAAAIRTLDLEIVRE